MNEELFYVYVMSFFNKHFSNGLTAEQVKYIFLNKALPSGCCQLMPNKDEKITKANLCRILIILGLDLRTGKNIFKKDLSCHNIPKTKVAFMGDFGTKARIMVDELLYILQVCKKDFTYFEDKQKKQKKTK